MLIKEAQHGVKKDRKKTLNWKMEFKLLHLMKPAIVLNRCLIIMKKVWDVRYNLTGKTENDLNLFLFENDCSNCISIRHLDYR